MTGRASITFNVTNTCPTDTTYISIGTGDMPRIQPTANSLYSSTLGSYSVKYTSNDDTQKTFQGITFTPTFAGLKSGQSEKFTVVVDNYSYVRELKLRGHTADIWETFGAFTLKQDCNCNCPKPCPQGYSGSDCQSCQTESQ